MNAAALDLADFERNLAACTRSVQRVTRIAMFVKRYVPDTTPPPPSPAMSLADVGRWFLDKWRQRLKDSDTFTVARQMRKQGIPLEIALFTLTRTTA